jgi:hypothetical protein
MTPVGTDTVTSPVPDVTVSGWVAATKPASASVLTTTAWPIPR